MDDVGPDDPIGTVRADAGHLAVRTYARHTEADNEELAWFIIDIGGHHGVDGYALPIDQLTLDQLGQLVASWPIVYQPQTTL